MPNANCVNLIGNLTRDPELRYTPQGKAVCEFSIAINSSYVNKASGMKVEEVTFIEIVAWGKTAEVCAEYLKKGRPVYVLGRLKQDRWESPEGKNMSKIRVVAENVQFLGGKPGAATQETAAAGTAAAGAGEAEDDNVPF
jgi:single-strand DNA-binding protein